MATPATRTRTQVAVVGGGPAGLMLSHLLHRAGVESVVVDHRTVEQIETTHRAGILEPGSVRLLTDTGVYDDPRQARVLTEGDRHGGIYLRFGGESHHVDFERLVGESVWLYPQTEVFVDLHRARTRDGADLRYGVADTEVDDLDGTPRVGYRDDAGVHEVTADLAIGADGSRSVCRGLVEGAHRFTRDYPYAWFGILCEAPRSAPELIYARSQRGFALISQRTESVQRMYFQCRPDEDPQAWSDDRIWSELQQRLDGPDGFELQEGPVVERSVLPFRSFVQTPMRHGRLLLAGDAAHTVPPTGAKGLNLALADARLLAEVVERWVATRDDDALSAYTDRALARVWRAQHFSYWMTTMMHRADVESPSAAGGASEASSEFDEQRQLGELAGLVSSEAGGTYLAEGYTGWPRR